MENNYVIFDDDLEILQAISKRLFTEQRMHGDEMRDNAERLRLLIERAKNMKVHIGG